MRFGPPVRVDSITSFESGNPVQPGSSEPVQTRRTVDNRRVEHRTQVVEHGEGVAQAVCTCGWRSATYGERKETGTMDALQQARDAADLHEWDSALS